MPPHEKNATLDDESIKALEKGQTKKSINALQFDTGEELIRFRKKWWQLWYTSWLFFAIPRVEPPQDSSRYSTSTSRLPRQRRGTCRETCTS